MLSANSIPIMGCLSSTNNKNKNSKTKVGKSTSNENLAKHIIQINTQPLQNPNLIKISHHSP
jgi:hypothetical protein